MSKMITRGSVTGTELSGAQLKATLTGMVDALTTAGLHSGSRSTINADTALTVDQCGLVLVDCTAGNVALTLPTSGDTTDDAVFLICRLDNTSNTLSYVRGGSDTVEGSSAAATIPGRGIIGLQMPADGTDWKIFSRTGATQAGARASIGVGAGADIASAATLNLTSRTGNIVRITGTTTTTALTMENGDEVLCTAVGAWPINVAGVLTYTCAAGDQILFKQDNSGSQVAIVFKAGQRPEFVESPFNVTASVAANAMTITLAKGGWFFRDPTLGNGGFTYVKTDTDLTLTISSGSTLGSSSGVPIRIFCRVANDGGTLRLTAENAAGGKDVSEMGLISTTAEGGSGAADSASTIYSVTSITNKTYRNAGIVVCTQATAGTWATNPSLVQGSGGAASAAISMPGVWVDIDRKVASNSPSIEFIRGITAAFDEFEVIGTDVVLATNNIDLNLVMSINGGSSWESSGTPYAVARSVLGANTTDYSTASAATNAIGHAGAGNLLSSAARSTLCFRDHFPNLTSTGRYKTVRQDGTYSGVNAAADISGSGMGVSTTLADSAVNGLQYIPGTGNITSGIFVLRGRRAVG